MSNTYQKNRSCAEHDRLPGEITITEQQVLVEQAELLRQRPLSTTVRLVRIEEISLVLRD